MNRFAFFILLLIFSGKQQMFSQEYLKVLGWNEYTLFPDFYRIRMQKSDSLTNTMLQNGILVNNNQFYKIINFDTIGAEIIYDIKIDTINDLGRIHIPVKLNHLFRSKLNHFVMRFDVVKKNIKTN